MRAIGYLVKNVGIDAEKRIHVVLAGGESFVLESNREDYDACLHLAPGDRINFYYVSFDEERRVFHFVRFVERV